MLITKILKEIDKYSSKPLIINKPRDKLMFIKRMVIIKRLENF